MANTGRICAVGDGFYHVIVRTVARDFLLEKEGKKVLYKMVFNAADFGGIQIITYCFLNNHLHLIVFVPQRCFVSDQELVKRLYYLYEKKKVKRILELWEYREKHHCGNVVRLEKDRYIERMYNLSDFVKTFKENFTQYYNRCHKGRIGTVWAGRFKSILLNGKPYLVLIVCLYVDLNPVRAKIKGVGIDSGRYAWSGIGAALHGIPRAMEGILMLGRLVGFANDNTSAEDAVKRYHDMLLGKADGRIRAMLDAGFEVSEKDIRFAESLRGCHMTLFELLHCKCRCFENGRMLGDNAGEMIKIKNGHPCKSVIPGYYSANGLKKTVVEPR